VGPIRVALARKWSERAKIVVAIIIGGERFWVEFSTSSVFVLFSFPPPAARIDAPPADPVRLHRPWRS